MLRHRGKVGEPAFPQLLLATILVQVNHDVGSRGCEVCWRVVKGQVAVLAYSHERDVDGVLLDDGVQSFALGLRVASRLHIVK